MVVHANKKPSQEHARRYNGPQCSEVDAVIPGADAAIVGKQDIVLQRRGELNAYENEMIDTILVTHRAHDHSCYVVLLPHGTDGWRLGRNCRVTSAVQSKEKKMSPSICYAYQLLQRPRQFDTTLRGGRLIQQYVCQPILQGGV